MRSGSGPELVAPGDPEGSVLQAQLVAMAPVQRDDPLGPGPVEPSEEPRGRVGGALKEAVSGAPSPL